MWGSSSWPPTGRTAEGGRATKVRSRLTLAFVYILLTVIVALEVPLGFNLGRRAESEVRTNALLNAQTIAATIGAETTLDHKKLQTLIYAHYPHTEDGRVIVVDPTGVLIADSMGAANLGRRYATPARPELQIVIREQRPTAEIRHSQTLGQDILVAAAPILDEQRFYGAVRQSHGLGEVQAGVRRQILGLIVIGLAALAAGLILAFGLSDSFSRPLNRLARTASRLGEGDLSSRVGNVGGAGEIQEVAASFDEMADRLEATVRAQREFVANASHQLRTPLTGMKLRLESAVNEAPNEELRRQLEAADREVDRLSQIVDRLLVMSRRIEEGGSAHVDVGDAVRRAVGRWEARARQLGATLEAKGVGGVAFGDAADLDQILDNIIDNAIAYAPGSIVVETTPGDGRVVVAVEDSGPGIPTEELPRVTDRFYRGKGSPPGGSGLGLAIVRDLAEKWGGEVSVTSPTGGGTRVEISLAATDEPRAEARP